MASLTQAMVPGQIARKEGIMKITATLTGQEFAALTNTQVKLVRAIDSEYAMNGGASDDIIGGSFLIMVDGVEFVAENAEGVVLTHAELQAVLAEEGV